MQIAALIPAYNEEKRIGEVVRSVYALPCINTVIVIDDGSRDATAQKAAEAGAAVLRHQTNEGKGAALRTGFAHLTKQDGFTAVITLDADGQHKPEEIPLFIEEFIHSEADIIIGNRMLKTKDMPLIRYLTNELTSWVTSLLAKNKVSDSQSGYRIISTEVLRNISLNASNFEIESEVIIKAGQKGFSIKEIPISTVYLPDSVKESKINPFVDTCRFFRLVLRNL